MAAAWPGREDRMAFWTWIVTLLVLIIGITGLVLFFRRGRSYFWSNAQIAHGAICIALSSLLSLIKLFHLPLGGSVTVASFLPIMLFAYVYGIAPGLLLGAIFGFFRFITGGGNVLAFGIVPFLLDYPIGYSLLGLCGLFRNIKGKHVGLMLGILAGCLGKTCSSIVSGAVFFADTLPTGFVSPWMFAFVYNGSYMLPEAAICIAAAITAGDRLLRRIGIAELNCRC